MSILRKFENFNEECVVFWKDEGNARLSMRLCGITHCMPDYHITRTNSFECVFEAIVSGKGVFRVGKNEYHPKAGDVYIAHIGSDHYYRTDPKDPWVKIWFNVCGTLVDELLGLYHLNNVNYLQGVHLEDVFRSCLDSMRNNLDNSHETATLVTHRLIYHIARAAATSDRPRVKEAEVMKQYIDERVTGNLDLDEMSAMIGKSQSQCRRIFSSAFGLPPYRYFLNRKLELARIMLERSTKSIKEIADELEFADQYYFSNLYKQHFGHAPSIRIGKLNEAEEGWGDNGLPPFMTRDEI